MTLEKLTKEKRGEIMGKELKQEEQREDPTFHIELILHPHSPAMKLFPITGQTLKAHPHLENSRELRGEGGVIKNILNWVRLNKNFYASLSFFSSDGTKMSPESCRCVERSGRRGRDVLQTGLTSIHSPGEDLLTDGPLDVFK